MTDKCIECKWCDPDPANAEQGVCRLNPPIPVGVNTPQGTAVMCVYPTVKIGDSVCSRFERQLVKVASAIPSDKSGKILPFKK